MIEIRERRIIFLCSLNSGIFSFFRSFYDGTGTNSQVFATTILEKGRPEKSS